MIDYPAGFARSSETDLYLMQNEFGLIRIGAAVEPFERCRKFERFEKCKITLVLVLPDKGSRAPLVRKALEGYRLVGNWYEGTHIARMAIISAVSPGAKVNWPYDLNALDARNWTDQLLSRRIARDLSR